MAESSLSMTFADLYQEVSDSLGAGLSPSGDALTRAKKRVNDGYRRFLTGSIPGRPPHVWSFLKATVTISMVASQFSLPLPDGFQSLLSNPKYDTGQSIRGDLREVTPEEIYDRRQATNNQAGVPLLFALRNAGQTSLTTSNRFELIFFPTPMVAYVLIYVYRMTPPKLVNTTDVPLGAQLHSDTILQAALAAGEQRQNDELGLHTKLFYERMAASIEVDARTNPRNIGYIGSRDDDAGSNAACPRNLSYNGVPLT